jgi:phosphopantothenoylcysteine synthetase/decarboxylase
VKKGLDLLIANQVGGADSAFGSDSARALLIARDRETEDLSLLPKDEIAERLFDRIVALRKSPATAR